MTIQPTRWLVLALVAAVTLGSFACQNKAKPTTVPETQTTESQPPTPPPTPPVVQPAAEPFPPTTVDKTPVVEPSIDQLNQQGVLATVYFAYNSNDIDDAGKATLQANAAWLKAHPTHTVEVGGHCDNRGSIGYNIALGDRRATAVKDYLVGLGVNGASLVAISYGEEQPVDPANNEAAWAKNRRAQFTIKS
jgi:peptidoglycan-associated lipoprotein